MLQLCIAMQNLQWGKHLPKLFHKLIFAFTMGQQVCKCLPYRVHKDRIQLRSLHKSLLYL